MKNITYIFSGGRKENFLNNQIQGKEFYYGVDYFELSKANIEIIEFNDNLSKFGKIFYFFDRIMNKFLSLPFYTSKLTTFNNLKIFLKTDKLFLINESVGCSTIFLILFTKIFKKIEITLFVMGLYSKNIGYKKLSNLHYFFIKLIIFFIDNVLFLGEEELKKAKKIHKNNMEKLKFFPFCIDTNFWTNEDSRLLQNNENIIFVGNDSNRDFKLFVNIVKKLPNIKFIVVSSSEIFNNINLPNVTILKGFWGNKNITDIELKKLYLNSKLSIIPLIETTQPSGQSVALQSMSLGLPVMITKTEGFWHKELFTNNENIFFIESSDSNVWTKKILNVFHNEFLLNTVSSNAKKTVIENYKMDNLYQLLKEITENKN